jgi:CubicO group peptidase (beta-lactamase class C family)
MFRSICAFVVLALHLLATTASAGVEARRPAVGRVPPAGELDAFIRRVMEANVAPGVAVAIVEGDAVVYARGFGFADRERSRRTDANTQFYIASTTKSFTALAAAILAARGTIDLDEPLSLALPGARFHPQVAPDRISLRDLLTHTHGLAPGGPVDFRAAFSGEFTDGQLLELLAFHGPATSGRTFTYSNLGYNVFGLVLDRRFEGGWKSVIQREVLDPLGMRSTTAWMSKADPARLAQPYEPGVDGLARVEYAKEDENMQSAGGHVSTANDLARYLVAQMNGGRIEGRQAVPEKAVALSHQQQADQRRTVGSFERFGWGLGWDMETYSGDTVLRRNGGFLGFSSHVSFMPDRKVGVVVLANCGGLSDVVADAVETFVYSHALATPAPHDLGRARFEAFGEALSRARAGLAKDKAARQSRPQTTPLPFEAYAGTYDSAVLGRMVWSFHDGRLSVRMGVARSDVEVYDGAAYQMRVAFGGSGSVVTFRIDPQTRKPVGLQFLNHSFDKVEPNGK